MHGDSFFDGDADFEMAELEAKGTRMYRLLRWATQDQRQILQEGGTVPRRGKVKETGKSYVAIARLVDERLEYSMGVGWHDTMRAARLEVSDLGFDLEVGRAER